MGGGGGGWLNPGLLEGGGCGSLLLKEDILCIKKCFV